MDWTSRKTPPADHAPDLCPGLMPVPSEDWGKPRRLCACRCALCLGEEGDCTCLGCPCEADANHDGKGRIRALPPGSGYELPEEQE